MELIVKIKHVHAKRISTVQTVWGEKQMSFRCWRISCMNHEQQTKFTWTFFLLFLLEGDRQRQHRLTNERNYFTYDWSWDSWFVIFLGWLTYERGSCWVNEFLFSAWLEFNRRVGSRITGWTNANGFLVVAAGRDVLSLMEEITFNWEIEGTG